MSLQEKMNINAKPALKNLKKGRYLDVSGMLTAMILPEEDIRHKQDAKNNLIQFNKAN